MGSSDKRLEALAWVFAFIGMGVGAYAIGAEPAPAANQQIASTNYVSGALSNYDTDRLEMYVRGRRVTLAGYISE